MAYSPPNFGYNEGDVYEFVRTTLGQEPDQGPVNYLDMMKSGSSFDDIIRAGVKQGFVNQYAGSDFGKKLGLNWTPESVRASTQNYLAMVGMDKGWSGYQAPAGAVQTKPPVVQPPKPKTNPSVTTGTGGTINIDDPATTVQNISDQGGAFAAEQAASGQKFRDEQEAKVEASIAAMQAYIDSQPSMEATKKAIAAELGLDAMRTSSADINAAINSLHETAYGLEDQVRNEKRPFAVNASRMNAIIQNRMNPINKDLVNLGFAQGNIGEYLSNAESELTDRMAIKQADAEANKEPYRMKVTAATDAAARNLTGFTAEQENSLQLLRDKFDAGLQLSINEQNRKNDLEKLEVQFNNEKAILEKQNEMDVANYGIERQDNWEVVTAGGRVKLVNPITGEERDFGAAPATGTGPISEALEKFIMNQNNNNNTNTPVPPQLSIDQNGNVVPGGVPNASGTVGYNRDQYITLADQIANLDLTSGGNSYMPSGTDQYDWDPGL